MYMYGHYWEVKGGGVKGGANHVSQKIKPQFIYASPISLYLKKKKTFPYKVENPHSYLNWANHIL